MNIGAMTWGSRGMTLGLSLALVLWGCTSGGGAIGVDVPPAEDVAADAAGDAGALDIPAIDTVACDDAADCKYLDATASSCEVAACVDGICALEPKVDGVTCDDGDPCTGWDLCQGGACLSGEAVTCDDGDPCTEDECVTDEGGCVYPPSSGAACDDEDLCTEDDACVDGLCVGAAVLCEDDDPCTADSCDPVEGCVTDPADDGTPCDDDDACTEVDLCIDGACAGSAAPDCDDGNPCTADGCDPEVGCVAEPLSELPCDDGNPCTVGDSCLEGVCASGFNQCNCESDADCADLEDGDLCNGVLVCEDSLCVIEAGSVVTCDTAADTDCLYTACLPDSGECVLVQAADGAPCEDGDLCTSGDACLEGVCGSGGPTSCSDGNPCTEDTCDVQLGCMHASLSGDPCDDGNPCTAGDACVGGACVSGENTCSCVGDGDCEKFEDGDLCNGTLICVDGSCLLDADSVVTCPAPAGPCLVVACDPGSGACESMPKGDGVTCDDGDLCTTGDACVSGVCEGGVPVFCEDGDPCTEDACDPTSGCVFPPLSDVPCEDGNPCTEDDACQDGACVPGENACQCESDADCEDLGGEDLCTGTYVCSGFVCQLEPATVVTCDGSLDTDCLKNTCNAETGECAMTPQAEGTPCEDGDPCTEFDACADGACDGAAVLCDDGTPCTEDLCDPVAGGCVFTDAAGACDDGNPCTGGDLCQAGTCVGTPLSCDDGNPCTFDLCADGACTHSAVDGACDDGDVCTQVDTCAAGACVGQDPLGCDDGDPCTSNTCDPDVGCQNKPADGPCDDGDACTDGDWCVDGACVPGPDLDCDDDNPCTGDSCAPASGCLHQPLEDIPCDTLDPCLTDGVCIAGACAGKALDCADDDPCTDDACETGVGCVYAPATGAPCEDGDACTVGDICQTGACVGGGAPNCDDGLVCTQDSCAPDVGCVNDPGIFDGEPCDDGDPCTTGDHCADGACAGAGTPDCDDDNPCTADSCDPETGCVNTPSNGSCDDGDPCTVGDSCAAGACQGAPLDCDDDDPCTKDLCDSAQGCFHPAVPDDDAVACDDGDPCSLGDVCVGGVCAGPDPKDCDDGIPCTEDSCDPGSGACLHDADHVACDDGNLCTDDACVAGQGCAQSPNSLPCDDGNPCTAGDACAGGVCTPGGNVCECQGDEDCADQEDGDLCNGTLVCASNECVVDPATVIVCDDGADTTCMKNTCAPATGDCAMAPVADGTPCDDGSLCTDGDACLGGACAGDDVICAQDQNPCTLATCQPAAGCETNPITGPCDDGDPCSVDEACVDGACVGALYDCDDDNVCTEDFCFDDDGAAQCLYQNVNGVACDDGSVCTVDDVCAGGACAGAAISCDDGNPCTNDACDPLSGCTHDPNGALCDDGDPCTEGDVCSTGDCAGTSKDCDDGNLCTDDACDPDTGDCQGTPNTLPCDDAEVCTEADACAGGTCLGQPVECDDGNACTADSCASGVGCVFEPTPGAPCDDDDLCTGADVCDADGGCGGADIEGCCYDIADCPSDYPCNTVACADNACVYSALDCDDGNGCTADVCASGDCLNPPLGEDGAVIYAEGFDGPGAHGWTSWVGDGATDQVYWSASDSRAYSPDASLYGGNPETSSYDHGVVDAWAASPWMRLPAGPALELSFRYWADFEEVYQTYDWVEVYVEAKGEAPAVTGALIYAPTQGQWVPWSATVPAGNDFGGKEARILLRFATVDAVNNQGEGVYVDDVVVAASQKAGCCEYDSDCFGGDLCLEDLCDEAWACESEPVDGSYLWDAFPTSTLSPSWAVTGTNPALTWSVQAERSVSTRYALYGGNPNDWTYDHGAGTTAATSGKILMDDVVAPVLRFNLFADLADPSCQADVLRVFASVTGGGISYQVQVYSRCDGTNGVFVPVEVDLSGFAGVSSVNLRFVLVVDDVINAGEGIYVDDVRVDEDGIPAPGCCATDADCADADPCTTDLCLGVAGAGVCIHQPLEVFQDGFEDGDAAGWVISGVGGGSSVTWFVTDTDAYEGKQSLQASNSVGTVSGSGTVIASTPAFSLDGVPSASEGAMAVSYARKLLGTLSVAADLKVTWQYRTANSGYWTTGGVLETVTLGSSWWTPVDFTFTPPSTAQQVRISFSYTYACNLGSCNARANIDDVALGWFGCM